MAHRENTTFMGGEDDLKRHGIEVVVLDNAECKALMKAFIAKEPGLWWVFTGGDAFLRN